MIKVFYTSSENNNCFGVNQVLSSLKSFLDKKYIINCTGSLSQFINVKYDLIHIHGCWKISLLFYFILSKIKKLKIVVSPHGMLDPNSINQKKIIKLIYWHLFQKFIFLFADQIIVNSVLEKKNVNKLIKDKNIKVIPHGIELDYKYPLKKNRQKNSFNFVFFSRIHPSKNLHSIINLWTSDKFFKKLNLTIYGEISDSNYFQKISNQIIKFDNINYKGALYKNKIKILSNYDIFIFLSKSENFGLVILEALASGMYIILSNNLPWKHLNKFKFASLINYRNNNLKKEIKKITHMKKYIRSVNYQKKTKLFLKKYYDWKDISNVYLKIYQNLIK